MRGYAQHSNGFQHKSKGGGEQNPPAGSAGWILEWLALHGYDGEIEKVDTVLALTLNAKLRNFTLIKNNDEATRAKSFMSYIACEIQSVVSTVSLATLNQCL